MATDTFARDLGYLDQFFAKLDATAAGLSPAAGARLRTLISEERTRWTEIRGLLAGEAPAPTAPRAAAAATPTARAPADPPPQKSEARAQFTVGSLIGRDR